MAGAISVQGGAGLAAALIGRYGALPVVAMRIAFSALLLGIIRRPTWRGASGEAIRAAIALGIILAAMNSVFYVAISRIPLGVAVTIEFWGPLAVAISGSRRPRDFIWVAMAAVGIYILAGGRFTADDLLGVTAAFVAGGCWALYIPTGGRVGRLWPDGRGLSLAMIVATAIVVPLAAVFGGLGAALAEPTVIGAGIVVAVFSSTVPYTLEIAALRRLPSSTFGVLMSLEPAIAAIVGFLVLGQVLGVHDILAIALVAVASAGASVTARSLRTAPGELEAA